MAELLIESMEGEWDPTRYRDTHREKIKRKLSLATAGELTRAAVQWVLENSS